MQVANHDIEPMDVPTTDAGLSITGELIAYIILIMLAGVLRLTDLGSVLLSDVEAQQALPAYHLIHTDAPGDPQVAQSPIVFWLQAASFSLFGGTEFAARVPGLIGGLVLVFTPLLLRDRLGREATFWSCLLLAVSPISLAAARFADPAVWMALLTISLLVFIWRYWDQQQVQDALIAAACFTGIVALAEPGGLVLIAILAASMFGALWWTIWQSPEERDTSGDELWQIARERLHDFPWYKALGIAFGVAVVVNTGFMVLPSGLDMVAQVLGQTLRGFVTPFHDNAPPAYPILALFVYEPLLVMLGVVGAVALVADGRATYIDRFAIMWALIAFFVLLLLPGGKPGFALWIVLPMMWLSVRVITELTRDYRVTSVYSAFSVQQWVKWLVAVVVLFLFLMLSVHWADVGRGLLDLPQDPSLTDLFNNQRFITLTRGAMWSVFTILFMIIGYFIAVSFWGTIPVFQGFGLGFVLFMIGTSLGTGWNAAVVNANNPYEIWHPTTVADDAYLLRDTLLEVARRDTKGFPLTPVGIVEDDAIQLGDDGIVAWLLRDFVNARFVDSLTEVRRDEVILLGITDEEPDLGGSYVGQRTVIRESWSVQQLRPREWIAWLTQRDTRGQEIRQDVTVLWLRFDIYDGIPSTQRIGG